jgi:hypothetical protein
VSRLRGPDDIDRLEDQELIRGSQDIGLISEVGFQQLDLIRYMRNYASAAHPNQNEIGAMQLLGWVETCIREVITLPESTIVAETRRLLGNVRAGSIDSGNAGVTAEFFRELTPDQSDNIAAGFFGIYVHSDSAEQARDGVRRLLPQLWPRVSEDQKRDFGVRHGRYAANGDTEEASRSRELLDIVDGSAFLPEPVRVVEMADAIDDLLLAHRGYNNFHTEPMAARTLAVLAGEAIPRAVTSDHVAALVTPSAGIDNGLALDP